MSIIDFKTRTGITPNLTPSDAVPNPKAILELAIAEPGITDVLVIARTSDGLLFLASHTSAADINLDLDRAKAILLCEWGQG